ncbi:peptidase S41 [Streptomyces albus subsp. albus]|nr:peptidase S41 [Streptomyces albus subsp. albus]
MNSRSDRNGPALAVGATGSVRARLAASRELADFVERAGTLTLDERRLIVGQALVMLEQNYVNLPLKAAMYGVDPVQRLRVLQRHLDRQTEQTMPAEWKFHAEMSEIFFSVKDLHTNYLLPDPFAGKIACLPFLIEEYSDENGVHFMVTYVSGGFTAPGFAPGAVVTHWSGIPISAAVELNAARFAGNNAAARHSRGVQSMTLRPLMVHLPPFEEWVTVSYIGTDGEHREFRESWRIFENPAPPVDTGSASLASVSQAVDIETQEANRAKVVLFAPRVIAQEEAVVARAPVPELRPGEVATEIPMAFRAQKVDTSSGTFGHLRIFTFESDNLRRFIEEFVRLVRRLPRQGLILDVRDNGGGDLRIAECLLQVLTPRRIVPEPTQFISTPLNLRICRAARADLDIDLSPWIPSMEQGLELGSTFSGAFPITPPTAANALGQQYFGPVVLVTNARCFSATDIFTAGFQDHGIGPVLGVDENTGAGGANVWTHEVLRDLLADDPDSPYLPLPKRADMRVAVRRALRVGAQSGTPVEDLGVIPDALHRTTRRDLLDGNADLLDRAGRMLASMRSHSIDITQLLPDEGSLRLSMRASRVDRLDIYVDSRPRASVDVAAYKPSADDRIDITVPDVTFARSARVEGFSDGRLVASATRQIRQPDGR